MSIVAPGFRLLFATLFTIFALVGTSMTVVGATLPKILGDFGWDYISAGIVLGANAVSYFIATFAAGYLVRLWGPKTAVALGLTLDGIGLMFFAASPDPLSNALLNFLVGLGLGCLEVAINWTTLQIDTEHTGRPMNLMHGSFAIGAILGPMILGVLLSMALPWTVIYRGIAVLFLICVALLTLVSFPLAQASREAAAPKHTHLAARPAYWLAFIALFLYVGVELGVSNWVAEYFVTVFGFSAASSALLVSLFWAGVLAGRFGVPLLYKGDQQSGVLIGLSALATGAVVLLALLGYMADSRSPSALSGTLGFVLVFLAGLGCSIYYPAVITLVGLCFRDAQSQAVGFAATGGGIGAFLFPFAMSAMAQAWGIRFGFATYGLFAVLMTIAAIMLAVAARKQHN